MLEHRLKQRYTIGSKEKPTLEECLNCEECNKHFHESIKKISRLLTVEEIKDLKLDSYIYACKKYNGRSNFLTFLYMVSSQHASRYIKKKLKNKDNFESFKSQLKEKEVNCSQIDIIKESLPKDLHNFAIDKYINMMSIEKISSKYKIPLSQVTKILDSIKKHFVE